MTRLVLVLGVLMALSAVGCGDDDIDGFAVRGNVEASSADLGIDATGFRFPTMTNLVSDETLPEANSMAGRCVIDLAESGPATAFEVSVVRSREAAGPGMREFKVQVDDVVDSAGVVTTVIGTRQFAGIAGLGTCSLVGSWVDEQDLRAGIVTDCVVENSDGQSATISADIEFQECSIR